MRAEFSKSVRRDAFLRANGDCELCGIKLRVFEGEYHHKIEAFLGGEATLENCLCLCKKCHDAITKARHPAIDKTRRLADKARGIRKKPTMPGSRSSKYKRLMNGETVLR